MRRRSPGSIQGTQERSGEGGTGHRHEAGELIMQTAPRRTSGPLGQGRSMTVIFPANGFGLRPPRVCAWGFARPRYAMKSRRRPPLSAHQAPGTGSARGFWWPANLPPDVLDPAAPPVMRENNLNSRKSPCRRTSCGARTVRVFSGYSPPLNAGPRIQARRPLPTEATSAGAARGLALRMDTGVGPLVSCRPTPSSNSNERRSIAAQGTDRPHATPRNAVGFEHPMRLEKNGFPAGRHRDSGC